jgi:Nucleotidyl transferase AbiEii toxin, Type IV TA system
VDYDATKRVLAAFEREGVKYVVFGAAAINLLGLPRATQDLDVFIEPTVENIERLRAALRSVYDDANIDEITAEDLLGEYPAIDYVPPTGTFHIDILTRLGEAFRYEDLESQRVPFEGFSVTVATPRMLVRMKKTTVRPKDQADVAMLRERFGIEEE